MGGNNGPNGSYLPSFSPLLFLSFSSVFLFLSSSPSLLHSSSPPLPLSSTILGGVYKGSFSNGFKDGHGVMSFTNTCRYDGDWQANRIHGRGSYSWADGRKYEGDVAHTGRASRSLE